MIGEHTSLPIKLFKIAAFRPRGRGLIYSSVVVLGLELSLRTHLKSLALAVESLALKVESLLALILNIFY